MERILLHPREHGLDAAEQPFGSLESWRELALQALAEQTTDPAMADRFRPLAETLAALARAGVAVPVVPVLPG